MNSPTTIVVTTKEETPSFIKKKHELAPLLKQVSSASKAAVALLEDSMLDEKLDIKFRRQCAKDLLDYQISITDQISTDTMNRLIAEIKVKPGGLTPTLSTKEDEDRLPILDFNTVREVT